jgi:hypothetical protein
MTVVAVTLVAVAGSSPAPRSVAACTQPRPFIGGAPSHSLLSILGVLRRPATPADALPDNVRVVLAQPLAREIFVNYIRRARVISGTAYYVMPILYAGCESSSEDMMLVEVHSDGSGSRGGGVHGNAALMEQGDGWGFLGSFGRTTVQMLVPDGVARVTLRYPAGTIGGSDRNHAPAFTVTTNVVGNLLVVTVPRGGARLQAPMTMIWRAASGKTVKAFSSL